MTRLLRRTAILTGLFVAATASGAYAQTSEPSGSALYLLYCASCHGPQAKGDGPVAANMTTKPADLTTISKRNGGKFPSDTVYRNIDGRAAMKNHGSSMPVWGDAFLRQKGQNTAAGGPDIVKSRIDALVKYIESIQQK